MAANRPGWADDTVDHALQLAAWRCREQLAQIPMLELDRVDLCVHRWGILPRLDLRAGGALPSAYQCTRCQWAPPRSHELRREELPAIGRGRFGKPESGNH